MNTKEIIELELDYLKCPIALSDIQTEDIFTGIKIIDNDDIVKKLNFKIGNMYTEYFEFDSHDQACWFNFEQEKRDKRIMLELFISLVDRLNKINDGSYIVCDKETKRIKNL